MKQLLLIVLISVFGISYTHAQCGFDASKNKMMQDPEYAEKIKAFESKIQHFISSGKSQNKSASTFTIPVVVHVLHLGEAVGSGTNISDAQIQSGIDRLNIVYRGLDPASPIDLQVEFTLAQRDPNCNATTGINRIDASGVANYATQGVYLSSAGADENTLKDLSRWPETDYLNIWIVSEIDDNNAGYGTQGYANFFTGSAYEGSVMMYTVFGYDPTNANPSWPLTFNRDNSTVIHEFGHYLHLYHTFEGDNGGSSCPADVTVGTDSDGCADTEIHKRHTSTCPANNDCTASAYGFNTLKNYMSYFNCTDRFTNDQKTRIVAARTGTSIVNSKGGLAPDASYSAPTAACTITSPQTNTAGIMNVELNGLNMPSGSSNTDGGSIDMSGSCSNYFEIDPSVDYNINVELFSVNYQELGVWIDWNNDGDFNDQSEQQVLSTDLAAAQTLPVKILYPASVTYGSYVRMRLINDIDDRYGVANISGPCFTPTYGQSEDYALHILTPGAGLPVTFMDLTAENIDNEAVEVNWSTASEANNDYFEVERSADGIQWHTVGKVNSLSEGNSTTQLDYDLTDYHPLEGTSYYRIKQVDYNGRYDYSKIRSVVIKRTLTDIVVYPNPANDVLYVSADNIQSKDIKIYNIMGQEITNQLLISTDIGKLTIDINQLTTGVYLVKTVDYVKKFYKE